MIRVLQLHDHACDFQTRRAVEQLAAGLAAGFDVRRRTIGAGGDDLNGFTAAWRLRKLAGAFDLVHAWSLRGLWAAATASFKRILFTPSAFPTARQIGWIRAIAAHRPLDVICPTATMRRAMVERGVALQRCHLVRPGVDFARIRRRRDRALRLALGFEEMHHVLLACGESTPAANHRLATWAAAILNVLDHRTRLLLWGRGAEAEAARRFASSLHQPELVTLAEDRLGRSVEFEELTPAADFAVVSASGPVPTLPIAICMAGAMPIIAAVTPTAAELLEDRHTALLIAPDVPRLISQRVAAIRNDGNLAWSLSDLARTEAYEFFPLTRFLEQHRLAYRTAAAGERIDLPPIAPGAGLRFHGRG